MTVTQVSPRASDTGNLWWPRCSVPLIPLSLYSAEKINQVFMVLSHQNHTPMAWPSDKHTSDSRWRKRKMHTSLVCIYGSVLLSVQSTAAFCKWASIWQSGKIMHPWLLTSSFPIRPPEDGKWVRGYPFDLWPDWARVHREKCHLNFARFNECTHTYVQPLEVSLFSSVVQNPITQS